VQATRNTSEPSKVDSDAARPNRPIQSKESLQAEVCAKFTALMTIFSSDVKLEGDCLKEFQVSLVYCENSIPFMLRCVCLCDEYLIVCVLGTILFQALADQQLVVLRRACAEGKCKTGMLSDEGPEAGAENLTDDALAQVYDRFSLEMLTPLHSAPHFSLVQFFFPLDIEMCREQWPRQGLVHTIDFSLTFGACTGCEGHG
jgi:hypothetical protein